MNWNFALLEEVREGGKFFREMILFFNLRGNRISEDSKLYADIVSLLTGESAFEFSFIAF